ncbi:putative nucleic acid-binding protein [Rhizobium aquaticum]|uniref:Ribonuclease VapC n=1 Tax=Rhizobium aquaticum TaxID=1549636 RepID=A0ABV2IU74_9HYPH
MTYVDTSVFIRALTQEAGWEAILQWLHVQPGGSLVISPWTLTEFSSGLALKIRTAQLQASQAAEVQATFNRLTTRSLRLLPIGATHFSTAARFVEHYTLGLRSGDALHLAIAFHAGEPLATLDTRLAKACQALGVVVEIP